jgi:hypothetical protein
MTMLYRIPWKPHGPRARTKACVAYFVTGSGVYFGANGARWIEITATTHADAQRQLDGAGVAQVETLDADDAPTDQVATQVGEPAWRWLRRRWRTLHGSAPPCAGR